MPPNTTSIIQPLDNGVIYNFKSIYKKKLVVNLLQFIEKDLKMTSSLLDSIRLVEASWVLVSSEPIKNAFNIIKNNQRIDLYSNVKEIIPPFLIIKQNLMSL